jgi:hypothetical protein
MYFAGRHPLSFFITEGLMAINRTLDVSSVDQLGSSELLLQASRRIDWQFLLPEPKLNHVAYVGPPIGTLPESLGLFSAALTVFEPSTDVSDIEPRFDVVVAVTANALWLRRAAAMVRPSGYLYLEVQRFSRPVLDVPRRGSTWLGSSVLQSSAGCRAAVEQLGMVDVVAHWHWPNFEACTEIIPIDDRAALLYAVARMRNNSLKSRLGELFLRMGRLEHILPCFSILARKPV